MVEFTMIAGCGALGAAPLPSPLPTRSSQGEGEDGWAFILGLRVGRSTPGCYRAGFQPCGVDPEQSNIVVLSGGSAAPDWLNQM
jgi:hypothetical protein